MQFCWNGREILLLFYFASVDHLYLYALTILQKANIRNEIFEKRIETE